eukprot:gene1833-2503_t
MAESPREGPLQDVVAFVNVSNSGGVNSSAPFVSKLVANGAKVARALSREVTHIIFKGDDDELSLLYDRASRVASVPATIVGVHWVLAAEEKGRRPIEREFVQLRPGDAGKLKTPATATRKRKRRSMQPKSSEDYGDEEVPALRDDAANKENEEERSGARVSLSAGDSGGGHSLKEPTQSEQLLKENAADVQPPAAASAGPGEEATAPEESLQAGPAEARTAAEEGNVEAVEEAAAAVAEEVEGAQGAATSKLTARFTPLVPPAGGDHAPSAPALAANATAASTTANVGRRLRVRWPDEADWHAGIVSNVNSHESKCTIDYDDGDQETLQLDFYQYEWLSSPIVPVQITPQVDFSRSFQPSWPALCSAKFLAICPAPHRIDVMGQCRGRSSKVMRINFSKVDAATQEIVKRAAKKLGGAQILGEGTGRTMKLMLAIANGAWVLSPAWLFASARAGTWVPEDMYEVDTYQGASIAREARAASGFTPLLKVRMASGLIPLLKGLTLFLEQKSQLRTLVLALGGKLSTRRAECDICTAMSATTRPPGLPAAIPAVPEE